jgi:DNA-binding YbaB/EbfC family protein
MAINPFELMKNFQNIQAKMSEMQAKLDTIIVTGSAGGGMVTISLNGKLEMTAVEIAPEVMTEDRVMIQDLIRAAYSDASLKIKDKLREELNVAGSGMDLPPGFMGM